MSSSSFHRQVRERILPALARLDGLEDKLDEVLRCYDALCATDLDYDVAQRPPFRSNLCEADCALELAYTFGGHDDCGVRYSFEPTCRRTSLKNRYTLCRDRVRALMREIGAGYDVGLFLELFKIGVPNALLLSPTRDPTATICAVHHYRDRPPRLKMYFGVDYDDDEQARAIMRALVQHLGQPQLDAQLEEFLSTFEPMGGGRMVGFDFEPGRAPAVKVYKQGAGLTPEALATLIDRAQGGKDAHEGVAHFQEIFLDGRRDPALFNLVTLGPSAKGPPRLKLYIRPVDLYDDGEALRRLRAWYAALDRREELELVERGLATVAPLEHLDETRGFFNYLSVDVGASGVSKTSVYYAPLIGLRALPAAP